MKKLLLIAISFAIAFTSCKKKTPQEEIDPAFNLPYSNLTTEQHKEKLETSGIDFINKVETLSEEDGLDVIAYFAGLGPTVKTASVSSIINVSKAAKSNNFRGVLDGSVSTDVKTLGTSYGVYTWNHSTDDWDFSPSTSKLEFKFPSDDSKTSNNATITVSYVASTVKPTVEGVAYELPSSVTAVLKVNSKEEFKISSIYEYKPNGTPTRIENNILLGTFFFKTKLTNDSKAVATELSLLKGTEKLLGFNFSVLGNADFDAIKNSDPTEILSKANASFEIMNFKLVGMVDGKGLTTALAEAEGYSGAEYATKEAAAWAKYSSLVAVNTTDNALIAKAEFVAVSDLHESYVEPRLVFKDGSKVSLGEFFEEGFSDFIDEFDAFTELLQD